MKTPAAVAGWLDDWMNPIVVKELRQAVRSRFIISIMNLFLLGQLLVVGLSVAAARGLGDVGSRVGRDAFIALLAVLHCACFIAVPLYASVRLASERSDANVDLLFISTLKPRAIVFGKLLSAMIVTALIYSVCAPFMTFTYLLRGIDIPSIFLLLGVGLVASLACTQFALFLAALPVNKAARAFLGAAGLAALIGVLFPVMTISHDMLRRGIGSRISSYEFLAVFGTWIACVLIIVGFLFELCVAIITPPSANRAIGVRILVTAGWIVTGAITLAWALKARTLEPFIGWLIAMTILLCVVMLGCVSERDELGARVRRQVPQTRLLRLLAFLFYSGSAGGMAWVCLLMLATLAVVASAPASGVFPSHSRGYYTTEWRIFGAAAAACLYTFAHCMTALLLWRAFFRRWAPRHTVGAIGVVLYAAVVVLPIIFMLFLKTDGLRDLDRDFIPGVPFSGRHLDHVNLHLTLSAAWAALVALLSVPWFWRQWSAFEPIPLPPAPQSPGLAPAGPPSRSRETEVA